MSIVLTRIRLKLKSVVESVVESVVQTNSNLLQSKLLHKLLTRVSLFSFDHCHSPAEPTVTAVPLLLFTVDQITDCENDCNSVVTETNDEPTVSLQHHRQVNSNAKFSPLPSLPSMSSSSLPFGHSSIKASTRRVDHESSQDSEGLLDALNSTIVATSAVLGNENEEESTEEAAAVVEVSYDYDIDEDDDHFGDDDFEEELYGNPFCYSLYIIDEESERSQSDDSEDSCQEETHDNVQQEIPCKIQCSLLSAKETYATSSSLLNEENIVQNTSGHTLLKHSLGDCIQNSRNRSVIPGKEDYEEEEEAQIQDQETCLPSVPENYDKTTRSINNIKDQKIDRKQATTHTFEYFTSRLQEVSKAFPKNPVNFIPDSFSHRTVSTSQFDEEDANNDQSPCSQNKDENEVKDCLTSMKEDGEVLHLHDEILGKDKTRKAVNHFVSEYPGNPFDTQNASKALQDRRTTNSSSQSVEHFHSRNENASQDTVSSSPLNSCDTDLLGFMNKLLAQVSAMKNTSGNNGSYNSRIEDIKSKEGVVSPTSEATTTSIVFLDALESQISNLMKSIASGSIPKETAAASAVSLVDELANNNHSDYGSECSNEELHNLHSQQSTPYLQSTKKLPSLSVTQSHSPDISTTLPNLLSKETEHSNRIGKEQQDDPLNNSDHDPLEIVRDKLQRVFKDKLRSMPKQKEHEVNCRNIIKTSDEIQSPRTATLSSTIEEQNSQVSSTSFSSESLEKRNTSCHATSCLPSSSLSFSSSSSPKTPLVVNLSVTDDDSARIASRESRGDERGNERGDEESETVSRSVSLASYGGSDTQLQVDSLSDMKDIFSSCTKSGNDDHDNSSRTRRQIPCDVSPVDSDEESVKSWDFPVPLFVRENFKRESSVTLEFQDSILDDNSGVFDCHDLANDSHEEDSQQHNMNRGSAILGKEQQCHSEFLEEKYRVSGTTSSLLAFNLSERTVEKKDKKKPRNTVMDDELYQDSNPDRDENKKLQFVKLPARVKEHERGDEDDILDVNNVFNGNSRRYPGIPGEDKIKLMPQNLLLFNNSHFDDRSTKDSREGQGHVSDHSNRKQVSLDHLGWRQDKVSPSQVFQEMKKRLSSEAHSSDKTITFNGIPSKMMMEASSTLPKNSSLEDKTAIKKMDDDHHRYTGQVTANVLQDNDDRIPSPPVREHRRGMSPVKNSYKKRPAPQPTDHLRRLRDQQLKQQSLDITSSSDDTWSQQHEENDRGCLFSRETQVKASSSSFIRTSVTPTTFLSKDSYRHEVKVKTPVVTDDKKSSVKVNRKDNEDQETGNNDVSSHDRKKTNDFKGFMSSSTGNLFFRSTSSSYSRNRVGSPIPCASSSSNLTTHDMESSGESFTITSQSYFGKRRVVPEKTVMNRDVGKALPSSLKEHYSASSTAVGNTDPDQSSSSMSSSSKRIFSSKAAVFKKLAAFRGLLFVLS